MTPEQLFNRRTGVLVLLLTVAASGWLLQQLEELDRREGDLQSHDPDYFMENFTQTTMNAEGRPQHRLNADLMLHYPDDGSTELVRPKLEVYNEAPSPWHVMADKGWVNKDNDLVLLTGEVQIWREGEDGRREVEVITRDVRVLPRDRYAETDQAATIRAPGTVYHAIGMRAKLNEDTLELLNRVRGRHEVNSENS